MLRSFLGCVVGLVLLASNASAGVVWDFNFSGATGGAIANITGISSAQGLASSILGFHDTDGSGDITTGDRFEDFTVIRLSTFIDDASGDLTPGTYGSGNGRTHEITIVTKFSGVQTTPNSYVIDNISRFDVYADFDTIPGPGTSFTGSNFFNLDTFSNGTLVENGVLGGASSGTNLSPTIPNGAIAVQVKLYDLLHTINGSYFELDSADQSPLNTSGNMILTGLFDGNNFVSPPAIPLGGLVTGSQIDTNGPLVANGLVTVVKGFDQFFGLSGTQLANGAITSLTGFDFAFQTRSNISFSKNLTIVPEPTSVLVFGLLGGLVAFRRRKRS